MKYGTFLILILLLTGCANSQRFTKVFPQNGINQYEAILVAKNEVLSSDFKRYFSSIDAKIRLDDQAKEYPDFWFVEVTPDVYMDFQSYIVVINKRNGEVVRSQDYFWPDKNTGFNWAVN